MCTAPTAMDKRRCFMHATAGKCSTRSTCYRNRAVLPMLIAAQANVNAKHEDDAKTPLMNLI